MSAKYDKPIPALFLTDFYKICHRSFYNKDTEMLVLYWTPRKTRLPGLDYSVHFGLQYFIEKYLIDRFNTTFFERPWGEVQAEYVDYLSRNFVKSIAEEEIMAFRKIYQLGYLPIYIRSLPEGTRVPIGCPCVEIRATKTFAFWLAEYIESIYSCSVWQASTDAAIADRNRLLLDQWYDKTVDDNVPHAFGGGNFSMRGMAGEDSVFLADAAHLLSFGSSATVGTGYWLKNYYRNTDPGVARGLPSSEHSVMETYGPDREKEAYWHISSEVVPNGGVSMVCDTWNAWRVLDEMVPELKTVFEKRHGRVVMRPDSGDPVKIICGSCELPFLYTDELFTHGPMEPQLEAYFKNRAESEQNGDHGVMFYEMQTDLDVVQASVWFEEETQAALTHSAEGSYSRSASRVQISVRRKTTEEMGFVTKLWEICGGSVNSKGYRVLAPYIGVIYGDAIVYEREQEIFKRLADHHFAANNVVLGFGSYSYQYVTRDSLGFALKATHGIIGGKEVPLFKDPITDHGPNSAGKKSQRGMCIVSQDEDGHLTYTDGHSMAEADAPGNLLRPVFKNGKLLVEDSFEAIRYRLHPNF